MKPMDLVLRSYSEQHPDELARILEGVPPEEAVKILRKLPDASLGPILERIGPVVAGPILVLLGTDHLRRVLRRLPPRQGALVLQRLETTARETALAGIEEGEARRLRDLLQYPEKTAGSLMSTEVMALTIEMKVQEAIQAIRRAPRQALHYLYVADRDRNLVGVLNMRDLLLGNPREPIEPLVRREIVRLSPHTGQEEVARTMRENGYLALPVVDDGGHLLGVVKQEQVGDVAQEEAFEDFQKMVGAGEDEKAHSPVSVVVKRRLPWLYVNLLTAFLAAGVVGLFEGIIEKVTALAVLLPIVAGQGGNTAGQALVIAMRGLALREILPGTLRRLLLKEFLGGLVNGFAVAVVTAGAVFLWDGRWALAVVIGAAMIVNMAVAALAGALIPLVLRSLGRDPAQSATIFVTTVTDCVGFAAFLGFAVLLRGMLL